MSQYVDLMINYPKPKNRLSERIYPSIEDKKIAKRFGSEFFDGERKYGYGGFNYNPIFWEKTVNLFKEFFKLKSDAKILDIGCAKGFMMVDFVKLMPEVQIYGIDISEYAIKKTHELAKGKTLVANCLNLPFPDKYFDLVISINTIHNLDIPGCIQSIKEIERVKKSKSYLVVDGWSTMEEKKDLEAWVLTAETVLNTQDWEKLFKDTGYTGNYSFWNVK